MISEVVANFYDGTLIANIQRTGSIAGRWLIIRKYLLEADNSQLTYILHLSGKTTNTQIEA